MGGTATVQVDKITGIGKLPVVPVGDTGTRNMLYCIGASFLGAHGDSRPGAGNGSSDVVCQLVGAWLAP